MDVATLTSIGLNETQAQAYIALVKGGSFTPPQAAVKLQLKRTNAYAVLEQLEDLGLATKKDIKKKITYTVANPIALERLARSNRNRALSQEKKVQDALPTLLKYFHTFAEQPGVRFYQGTDEIKDIYNDMLRTGCDIYVLRSARDQDLLTTEFFKKFRMQKSKLGIATHIINPANNAAIFNDISDKTYNEIHTQLRPDCYTANVEMAAYGNKLSIISFGEEAIGMIIDSPQIADSYRQMFVLMKIGASHA